MLVTIIKWLRNIKQEKHDAARDLFFNTSSQWFLPPCIIPSPLMWAGTGNLPLMKRILQSDERSFPILTYKNCNFYTFVSIFLSLSILLQMCFLCSHEMPHYSLETYLTMTWRKLPVNSKQESEALSPPQKTNLDNNHIYMLGNRDSPAEPLPETTTALSYTFIAVLWEISLQRTKLTCIWVPDHRQWEN